MMEVNIVIESIFLKTQYTHILMNFHAILITLPHSKYLVSQQNERQLLTTVININTTISTSIIHTTLSTTTIQLTTSTQKQRMSIPIVLIRINN
jgi:hypothetical protein